MKEMGANAIRTSHNPPAPEFLRLCDKMGFLVMDEAFDESAIGKKKWIKGRNVGMELGAADLEPIIRKMDTVISSRSGPKRIFRIWFEGIGIIHPLFYGVSATK